ncbi:flagellar hook-basal body complex protein FliE [Breznakiella homolactica]|uniref:Flagellar hook-basal body complex protein FliE n=1 Tax=Breznakiella homolactica TaxID=2798577 RepID=A0A7T8B9P6_9SPIR|nr:flagellar hook-basal body complex protein FliE [Breznakiella homolactica]QQO07413.1 flagellar hook-basal body complex protein FliE [Breznakiella homolactica]
MTIYKPELVSGDKVPMAVTHPKHFVPGDRHFISTGAAISELGNKIGAESVVRAGSFEDTMLKALDKVSAYQQAPSNMMQMAITDPGSVDVHDITIAQAKANLSLNITRTVLDRIVRGWKDLINTR